MDLQEMRQNYINEGYDFLDASAKVCQDILLAKISKSALNRNITIKGGVVMHNISKDSRRATRDLDLDFIKYSLDDKSIKKFYRKIKLSTNRYKHKYNRQNRSAKSSRL